MARFVNIPCGVYQVHEMQPVNVAAIAEEEGSDSLPRPPGYELRVIRDTKNVTPISETLVGLYLSRLPRMWPILSTSNLILS